MLDYVQVRLAVNRNQDLAMNAGRAAVEVEYDIGFDAEGKLLAVEMQAYLMGGAQLSGSFVDLYQLTGNIDQVSQLFPLGQQHFCMAYFGCECDKLCLQCRRLVGSEEKPLKPPC